MIMGSSKTFSSHPNIDALLSSLSLEEKIGQTNMLGGSIYHEFSPKDQEGLLLKGSIGSMMFLDPETNNTLQKKQLSLSPHAVPILFACDNIHGVQTIFPNPLGEASSFDPVLAEKTASCIAKEEQAMGARWNFAPMVDIARDARWGRNVEGAGEDPLLAGDFGAARVQGLQGNQEKIDGEHVASTVKHFAGYSFLEGGEDYERVNASKLDLENYAYPVYKKAIQAGASSVMLAFTDLEGVPCTANRDLVQGLLREKWGFEGVVVSDYAAVRQLYSQHYSASEKEAVYDAFTAGLDVDMESRLYIRYLKELIDEGRISLDALNQTVRRILLLKDKVGLFEQPYTDLTKKSVLLSQDTLSLAEQVALRSALLLKNTGVLPLKSTLKVGLMGPGLADPKTQNGPWSYDDTLGQSVTYRDALLAFFPRAALLKEAAEAKGQDVILYFAMNPREESGEACSLTTLELHEEQRKEIRGLVHQGRPVVLILTSSRPLAIGEELEECAAVLDLWTPGMMGGSALAKLLLGVEEPTGHAPISFPRAAAQCPIYYNRIRSCRPYNAKDYYTSRYLDLAQGPLVPFGFGLSYYPSRLSHFGLREKEVALGGTLEFHYTIENLSEHPLRRLAQFYAEKEIARPLRPEKALIAYHWVHLAPYEKKEETFVLPVSSFIANENDCGAYRLFLSENSALDLESVPLWIKR